MDDDAKIKREKSIWPVPYLLASDPCDLAPTGYRQVLTASERARLKTSSEMLDFRKGAQIYERGETATAIFNIVAGAVKSYVTNDNGREHINGFLFAGDVIGLPVGGKYLNSTRAITDTKVFRISAKLLQPMLLRDASLDYAVIQKLCDEVGREQAQIDILNKRNPAARLARFLLLREQQQRLRGEPTNEIFLPMSRLDISDYLGVRDSTLSRAFHTLTRSRIIEARNKQHIKVIKRFALADLAAIG